ncbi:hypothetical protein N864_15780 [Intrasporangium chromatireducens Q5-1]|uniref:Uncharacterized protein n=1 Tax=Intrasporangium chromatireducens Q5-1 TaxID=584657 RepID=W9GCR1_9MICO|nr:hypothetical protein [Intrasporangium chromatireducens]EWT03986.1 hypothetical protein N864_15780 [Intrasporangium chromatireducens Q5-1]
MTILRIPRGILARLGLNRGASAQDVLDAVPSPSTVTKVPAVRTPAQSEDDATYYALFPGERPAAIAATTAENDDEALFHQLFPDERPN